MKLERKPHAALDLDSRVLKGRKIERLLRIESSKDVRRLLEVGTGSGGISHYFARHAVHRFDVDSVDVTDCRQVTEGYRFHVVGDVMLPFQDETFDVVVTNHVIEHVGDDRQQNAHLTEIHRVLKPDGVVYLAVPNRWMLVEPHYRVPLLSWWPERWRSGWLRLWKKGDFYDCRPLQLADAERRLREAGFEFRQVHAEAMRALVEIEFPQSFGWRAMVGLVPDGLFHLLRHMFPTLIWVMRKVTCPTEPYQLKL
jgi:SAM-dependent methyltransferase